MPKPCKANLVHSERQGLSALLAPGRGSSELSSIEAARGAPCLPAQEFDVRFCPLTTLSIVKPRARENTDDLRELDDTCIQAPATMQEAHAVKKTCVCAHARIQCVCAPVQMEGFAQAHIDMALSRRNVRAQCPTFSQGGDAVLDILEGLLVDLQPNSPTALAQNRSAMFRMSRMGRGLGVQYIVDCVQLRLEVLPVQVALLLHFLDSLQDMLCSDPVPRY